jgi:hypothetical protein
VAYSKKFIPTAEPSIVYVGWRPELDPTADHHFIIHGGVECPGENHPADVFTLCRQLPLVNMAFVVTSSPCSRTKWPADFPTLIPVEF